jgi:sugar phosphate isomerase/epimerase
MMKLGLDLYSVRSQGWSAIEMLDYCHDLGVDVAHFGLNALGPLVDANLRAVKAHADDLGLEIEVGMGSICETSTSFPQGGASAVERTQEALHVAGIVGSPVLKVLLGSHADRRTETPLETHIQNCIDTLQAVREQAMDLGIILAMENHVGDLQGWELKDLIERSGPEYVGACLDPGNSIWATEAPLTTFGHVAPYIVTSHIRDSVVWSHPRGAAFQWVALGEGNVEIETLAERFKAECPGASFTLEIITGRPPQVLSTMEDDYWNAFPDARASEFACFERLVRRGLPYQGTMVVVERGADVPEVYADALAAQQRYDVERSVAYARDVLGMGA